MSPRDRRIPLSDADELDAALRRGRLLRLVLAAAAVAAAAATVAAAALLKGREAAFVARGSSGVIVLDVSASISSATYGEIARVLHRAAESGGRYGLVLFSDTAYEALPLGTPGTELRAYERFFRRLRPGERRERVGAFGLASREFPANPWGTAFSAGTRISTGLRLARTMLARNRGERSSIVLVSDLATAQSDLTALQATLVELVRAGIPLRVVALVGASGENKAFFEDVLKDQNAVVAPPSPRTSRPAWAASGRFPFLLALGGAALLVLLALNELWCERLTWGQAREVSA